MKKLLSALLALLFLVTPSYAGFFGGGAGSSHPGHRSGQYYAAGMVDNGATTLAVTAGHLYAIPTEVKPGTAFTELGIEVTTLSAGNAKLCVYKNNNGYPGDLVYDGGASPVSTGTTGNKTVNPALTAIDKLYWLAFVADATPTLRAKAATVRDPRYGIAAPASSVAVFWDATSAYASGCVNPYPGGASVGSGAYWVEWLKL